MAELSPSRTRALVEAGIALASELSLDAVLQKLVDTAAELTGARYAALGVIDSTGRRLAQFITTGVDAKTIEQIGDLPTGHGLLGLLISDARPLRLHDLHADPHSAGFPPNHPEMTTFLGMPILLRGVAYGNFYLTEKEGGADFTAEDEELMSLLAAQAAVAIDLSERVARESLRGIVAAQELERRRLARELHDETGQALTSILLGLRAMEDAKTDEQRSAAAVQLRELVVSTLQDVRQLAVELRPTTLDDFGLAAALERLVETWAEQTQITVELEDTLPGRLPTEIETALYRIVQEALTNIVKHARASRVSIVLSERGRAVTVVIEDDGIGFAPEREREDGLGLIGMRERVALVGGRLQIESRAGKGTTLLVEVPVP